MSKRTEETRAFMNEYIKKYIHLVKDQGDDD